MAVAWTRGQFLQLGEGSLQERKSRDQRRANKDILAANQRHLWQSTVDCTRSNTGMVALQVAVHLLLQAAAKAPDYCPRIEQPADNSALVDLIA